MGRAVLAAAGTRPNHPCQRVDMAAGRPVMLSEGDNRPCESDEVWSSIGTATDKECREQDYRWTPYGEDKAEMRPVTTHH
jgi:hypothetical protein